MAFQSIKQQLKNGKTVFGTWIRIPSPLSVELLGSVGFDFLHLDMEHGSIDIQVLDYMVLAAKSQSIPLSVRVASQNPADLYRMMDIGINSFILPRIESAEQCAHLLAGIRYAPAGIRGVGGPARGNNWGLISLEQHMKEAEEATIAIVQIESQKGLDHIHEIIDVPGIDVVYIGPMDLSSALGYTGDVGHPIVQKTIHEMVKIIKNKGLAVGIHVSTREEAAYWEQHGIQYFTIGMDLTFLRSAAQSLVTSLKG